MFSLAAGRNVACAVKQKRPSGIGRGTRNWRSATYSRQAAEAIAETLPSSEVLLGLHRRTKDGMYKAANYMTVSAVMPRASCEP